MPLTESSSGTTTDAVVIHLTKNKQMEGRLQREQYLKSYPVKFDRKGVGYCFNLINRLKESIGSSFDAAVLAHFQVFVSHLLSWKLIATRFRFRFCCMISCLFVEFC